MSSIYTVGLFPSCLGGYSQRCLFQLYSEDIHGLLNTSAYSLHHEGCSRFQHRNTSEFKSNALLSQARLSVLLFPDRKPQPPSGFNLTERVGQSLVIRPRCWKSQKSDKNSVCRSQTASAKLLNAQHYIFRQPCNTKGTDA